VQHEVTRLARDYAAKQVEIEAGMQQKSAEFREKGGELYSVLEATGTA